MKSLLIIDEVVGFFDFWFGFDFLVGVLYSLFVFYIYVGIEKYGVVKEGNIEVIGSDFKCRFFLFWCNVDLNWGKLVWVVEVLEM